MASRRVNTMEAEAQQRFKAYLQSYSASDAKFPQLRSGLLELSRVEVQLERIAKALERKERAVVLQGGDDEDVFLAEGKDGEDQSALMKVQQQLRQQQTRIKKSLNLSLERNGHLKAKPSEEDPNEDPLKGVDD